MDIEHKGPNKIDGFTVNKVQSQSVPMIYWIPKANSSNVLLDEMPVYIINTEICFPLMLLIERA